MINTLLIKTKKPQICIICKNFLWEIFPLCTLCSKQLIKTNSNFNNEYINNTITKYEYTQLTKYLIHKMKFNQQIGIAVYFGYSLALSIDITQYDQITYIPTHYKRWLERKFNPAQIIAKTISQTTNLPLKNYLTKTTNSQPLSLSNARNVINIYNNFSCKPVTENSKILLIDDIITTGATATAAAIHLIKQGAKTITLATAVKTNK